MCFKKISKETKNTLYGLYIFLALLGYAIPLGFIFLGGILVTDILIAVASPYTPIFIVLALDGLIMAFYSLVIVCIVYCLIRTNKRKK